MPNVLVRAGRSVRRMTFDSGHRPIRLAGSEPAHALWA